MFLQFDFFIKCKLQIELESEIEVELEVEVHCGFGLGASEREANVLERAASSERKKTAAMSSDIMSRLFREKSKCMQVVIYCCGRQRILKWSENDCRGRKRF